VKAVSFRPDYTASAVASSAYAIQLLPPQLSPAAGTYAYGQTVTVTAATAGTTLRYTVSSTDPTANDAQIPTGTVLRPQATVTLKVKASKAGFVDSATTSATYTITGTPPNPGQVAAGSLQGFFRTQSDGSVRGWGQNSGGELGDGSATNRSSPVLLTGFDPAVDVASGAQHTIGRRSDGSVYGTGQNASGQIGTPIFTNRTTPAVVSGLASGVSAIAAGDNHSVVLKTDGTVWAFGDNASGQLGNPPPTDSGTPLAVQGLTGTFTAVAAGANHGLALKSDGTVWAWGVNGNGQLGDNSTTQRSSAVAVTGLSGLTVTAIAARGNHSLALISDGTVRQWGQVQNGQADVLVPAAVSGLGGVRAIAAGQYQSVAARADGSVFFSRWRRRR
jgi:alpha-tubulin suppressor-like RCC1 family protein